MLTCVLCVKLENEYYRFSVMEILFTIEFLGRELTGVLLQDSSVAPPSPLEVGETSVSNVLPSSASPPGAASCRHRVRLTLAQSEVTL